MEWGFLQWLWLNLETKYCGEEIRDDVQLWNRKQVTWVRLNVTGEKTWQKWTKTWKHNKEPENITKQNLKRDKLLKFCIICNSQSGLPYFNTRGGFELCHWPSSKQIEPLTYPTLEGVTNFVYLYGAVWLCGSLEIHIPIFPSIFLLLARPLLFFPHWLLPRR